jgi:hypothetical protein
VDNTTNTVANKGVSFFLLSKVLDCHDLLIFLLLFMGDETNSIYTAPSGNVADELKRTETLYDFTVNHSFISCGFLAAKCALYTV